jgi:GalNAc5-diNAcBac-PP-undecaprenol beta-1,3-glucosyltransferase
LRALAAVIEERAGVNFLATKYEIERDGRQFPSSLAPLQEGFYGLDLFLRGNPLACNVCVRRENPQLRPFVEDRRYAVFEDWMFMVENLATDHLYLSDRVTISLIDHVNRSMRGNNQEIIRKNRLARDWIIEHVPLGAEQKKILDGYSHYFCAIHSYLDGDRSHGLRHLAHARRQIGINKQIVALFIKLIAGQKLLHKAAGKFKKD